jgi:hypothetical protein
MIEPPSLGLRMVGPDELPENFRECLRPGAFLKDRSGIDRRLPAYFYEVPSWEVALSTRLAPNFGLWELIDVDVREAAPVRSFPRYVPCAIAVIAAHLQLLRSEVARVVRIAANGGYRSPAHLLSPVASPHSWAAAANIYRIGDEWLDTPERIEKYREVARRILPGIWTRPYGARPGHAFDHLHLDLGYVEVEPHGDGPESNAGAETRDRDGVGS